MGLSKWAIVDLRPERASASKLITTSPDPPVFRWTTEFKLEAGSVEAFRLDEHKRVDLSVKQTPTDGLTDLQVNVDSYEGRLFLAYTNTDIIRTETKKSGVLQRKTGVVYSYHEHYLNLDGVFVFLPKWGFPVDLRKPSGIWNLHAEKFKSQDRLYLFYLNPNRPIEIAVGFQIDKSGFKEFVSKNLEYTPPSEGVKEVLCGVLKNLSIGFGPLSISLAPLAEAICP